MELREFGEFKDSRRYPWLLLALVVVAAAFFILRRRAGNAVGAAAPPPVVPVPVQVGAAKGPPTGPVQPVTQAPVIGPALPAAEAQATVARARQMESAGQLVPARQLLLDALHKFAPGQQRAEAEHILGRVNVALVTSAAVMPEKVEYAVRQGDSLAKIAEKFGTTSELLQLANRIGNPNRIRVGERLHVLNAKLTLMAWKSRNEMLVEMDGKFFKRYRVGTGKSGKTPAGTFKVVEKIKEPVWWKPDGKEVPYGSKENILGTRWMTLQAVGETPKLRGYGIHGTWEPDSIGKAESAGCIRMLNSDVEELFALVPLGTPVTIQE